MTIVSIVNIPLQVPENGTSSFILELVAQMRNLILPMASRSIEESLETELDRFFGRERYEHRHRNQPKETGLYRSHQRQDFRRNGHYQRQLAMQWGRVNVQLPQAK